MRGLSPNPKLPCDGSGARQKKRPTELKIVPGLRLRNCLDRETPSLRTWSFWVLPILELPDRFGGMEQNWNKMLGQKTTTPAPAGSFRLRNKIGLLFKKSVVARFVAN